MSGDDSLAAVAEVADETTTVTAPAIMTKMSPRARPESQFQWAGGGAAGDQEADIVAATKLWGADVVQLSSGDPDLPTPAHISAAAIAAIAADEKEKTIHYTPKEGMAELRRAISDHMQNAYGLDYQPEEIAVTNGVQQGLMACFLALCAEGDEILAAAPGYRAYMNQANLVGAKVIEVPVGPDDDFVMMPKNIKACITPASKVLVHCSPHNPSGAVTPPEVVKQIAELAIQHDLMVIADEIYADMLYDGHEHLSIASLPGMRERTVVLKGCSKCYAMTGWRVGYLAAPAGFTEAATAMAGQISLSVSSVSQYAAIAAFSGPQDVIGEYMNIYKERRQFMMSKFHEMGFQTYGGNGGYMMQVDLTSGPGGLAAKDFALKLLQATGIKVGASQFANATRFATVTWLQPMETLVKTFEKIEAFVATLVDKSKL